MPACSVVGSYRRLRLDSFVYFNKVWVRLIQKQVRSKPKEATVIALRSEVFTEEKMAIKVLCDVMLRSLLDMLLQNIGAVHINQNTWRHI